MEYLAPLGIVIRGVRAPAFNKDVNISWANAQLRAIVRQAGLPDTTIEGQKNYQKSNAKKMNTLNSRLEKAA